MDGGQVSDFEFNLDDPDLEDLLFRDDDDRKITPGYDEFLPETPFDPTDSYPYTVAVGTNGVTVYSECCGDVMSRGTAVDLYKALGEYLDATWVNP